MTKHRLTIFDSDKDSADMFEWYFKSREFDVEVIKLEEGWVESKIIQICKIDCPDAITIHESEAFKMLSLYKSLRDEVQTENMAIALISVRWPTGYVDAPEYLFVNPYDVSKVGDFIYNELEK